jgi:hypothetical protein
MACGEDCATCGGTGLVQMRRCPSAIATPEASRAVEAAQLVESGILPVAGGWRDQAALFTDAARIVLHARARYRQKLTEHGKGNS